MTLPVWLALCTAVHGLALMYWFGALAMRPVTGVALHSDAATGLRIAALLALGTGALWPALQTGIVLDDAAAALDPRQLAMVLGQTTFGRIWLARELLVAVALALACGAPRAGGALLLGLVGGALASLALIGHAAGVPGGAGYVQRGVLALHLLAAGAWVGMLPALWRAARRLPRVMLAAALRRFSGFGLGFVAVVIASGLLTAWWRIGTLDSLLNSDYSHLLLVKISLVLLMGVAALRNRNRYTPALETLQLEATDATAPVGERARRGLVTSISAEIALAVAVVVVACFLEAAQAPR
jgi:putative copper resistance protein D